MLGRFVWWFCRDGHCKMLSDRRPACPVCYWAMDARAAA